MLLVKWGVRALRGLGPPHMTSSQTPQLMPRGPHIRLSSRAATTIVLVSWALEGGRLGLLSLPSVSPAPRTQKGLKKYL